MSYIVLIQKRHYVFHSLTILDSVGIKMKMILRRNQICCCNDETTSLKYNRAIWRDGLGHFCWILRELRYSINTIDHVGFCWFQHSYGFGQEY